MDEGRDLLDLPLDALCDAVLERYHTYLHGAIPRIRGWLGTLADRELAAVPDLAEARAAFADLSEQTLLHLAKEEAILFPALAALAHADCEGGPRPQLPFPTVLHPIRLMETEHARLAASLMRMREVTANFRVPPDGSEAWRRCYRELERLDQTLSEHLQVENDVLFPRALDLERRLPS
jgi:regulator of cell morphogenesis and NO signaling